MTILFELGLIVGLLMVSSNPSPYYGAFGLVGSAGAGCLILVSEGASFLSLVLFLVYLGGMLVVFGYSAALAAEPYPEAWGTGGVVVYLIVFIVLLWLWYLICGVTIEVKINWGYSVYGVDWFGVAELYMCGGKMLLILVGSLLLSLFVVLEVVRGHYSGVLRAL